MNKWDRNYIYLEDVSVCLSRNPEAVSGIIFRLNALVIT